jgi:phage terminase small subunit
MTSTTAQRGVPNKVSALEPPADGWPPAMEALDDRRKRFVLLLFSTEFGHGAQSQAARLAGFGTDKSTAKTMAVIGSQLAAEPRIQAALVEMGRLHLTAAVPLAVKALIRLLQNPKHRDHARAIDAVLSRTYPTQTSHHLKIETNSRITISADQALARIRELAAAVGVDVSGLPPLIDVQPQPKPEEAEAV